MNYFENYFRVRPIDIVSDNNILWATLFESNNVYEINEIQRSLRIVGSFKEKISSYSYCGIAKYNNSLFFIPKSAPSIAVMNILSGEISYVDIEKIVKNHKKNKVEYNPNIKFISYLVEGNKLYMFGYFYPGIICIDMESFSTTLIDDWIDEINPYLHDGGDGGYFNKGIYYYKNKVYLSYGCIDGIAIFELNSSSLELIKLNSGFEGILDIIVDGDKLWFTGQKKSYGKIGCYDLKKGEMITTIDVESSAVADGHHLPQWKLINYGDYIWLFPYTTNNSYRINKNTIECEPLGYVTKFSDRRDEYGELANVLMIKQKNNIVYLVSFDGVWTEVDMNNETAINYEYKAPRESVMHEFKIMLENQICWEYQIGIENFIDIMIEKNEKK